MGMQTNCWGETGTDTTRKSLSSIFKSPTAYVVATILFIASLLFIQHAFAKGGLHSSAIEELGVKLPVANTSASKSTGSTGMASEAAVRTPATSRMGLISQDDIQEMSARVETLSREKQQLDNQWRIERNKHDSLRVRLDDSQKTIRLEMDEVLLSNSPRARLDELLGLHEQLSRDEKAAARKASEAEELLASHQLTLVQAQRDLERMQTSYASQQREEDMRRVQEIAHILDRELRFSETISFKCSPNKALATCLEEHPLESRMQGWVQNHYEASLKEELLDKVDDVRLSPDWYSARIQRDFSRASMNLDGSVSAEVDIRAGVQARKMMACAILRAPADLCEVASASLIVRSNKYGDQVYINGKGYGSTPLSLILDPGLYNIEVKYNGLTQKRTLNLDENRYLNFVF